MNNIKRITSFGLVAGMFLVSALATSSLGTTRTAFAQNISTAINQTAAQMNQTAAQMNQTASQMNQTAAESANKTSTNSAGNPKLTMSDIQDIRKTLDEVRKDIADGKATEALKSINDMDDKLLVSISKNPPSMLEKSSGNDNNSK